MSQNNTQETLNINEILNVKLTHEKVMECKEAFDMHDSDKDEIITTTQLVSALRTLGYNTNQIIIERIKEVDIESEGGVGKLKFEDFLDFVKSCIRYAFTKADMVADLKLIDVNNDGRITKQQLQNYLKDLDIPLGDEEIEEAVNAADLDNDGWVDYNEFSNRMCLYDGKSSN